MKTLPQQKPSAEVPIAAPTDEMMTSALTAEAVFAESEKEIETLNGVIATQEGVIAKQQRDIASLSVQLAPLGLLRQMEKIGQFAHIGKQEAWGFADFERQLAHYPARVHRDMRTA